VAPSWGQVSLTTAVTGTLPATNGGTGQASYTVGDLLYASSTTALSRLSDVATGSVLVSGGTSTAPAWSSSPTITGTTTSGYFIANGAITSSLNAGAYSYGTLAYSDTNIFLSLTSSVNSYNQMVLQNTNSGSSASTNFIVSNNNGTNSTYFGEFGMNSSGFTGSGAFNAANTVYLDSTSADLAIGTTTANAIHFVVNSGATDAMTISSGGTVTAPTLAYTTATGATSETVPLVIGGTTASSTLTLESTSGTGTSDAILFKTGSQSERMRIDTSGNVGIGTASPALPLDILNATPQVRVKGTGTTTEVRINAAFGSAALGSIGTVDANPFMLFTNNTERMRIDSSGNVLVGTTSSAAVGGSVVLSSGGFSMSAGQGIGFNIGYNGGFKYVGNGYGLLINQTNGDTVFQRATNNVSGAGAAATLNESMRIDSSGNVGIGTASPGNKLTVTSTSAPGVFTNTSLGGVYQSVLSVRSTAATTGAAIQFYDGTNDGYVTWYNQNLIFAGTGGAERMRIDSSGNLLVGTTSGSTKMYVVDTSTSVSTARFFKNVASSQAIGALTIDKYDNTSTTSQIFVQFTINNQGTGSGQINANGASQAAFGSFSDQRLKENIVDLPSQLANICALRPVEFDYKDGSGHQIGFIAQEMQTVYPDAVGVAENEMLTVTGWSKTEARLVAAIQELKSEFEAYKAAHP